MYIAKKSSGRIKVLQIFQKEEKFAPLLSVPFIRPFYPSLLSVPFIRPFYPSLLSVPFIRPFYPPLILECDKEVNNLW